MNQDYQHAVNLVLTERRAGPAYLKQKMLLSDSKVSRIIKQLEKDGVISKAGAGGARTVLKEAPKPVIVLEEALAS